jgi:prolyl-tRNA editing enzyme YbaK/EbsC (Cys-tRNA(Pro) deacylase)
VTELDPAVARDVERFGIEYEKLECTPDLADTDLFCANYGIPRENAANTILIASKSEPKTYVACLVLSNARIDVNHAISKLVGIKRLSFASPDETKELTGQMIGGVTVFALPETLTIYVDQAVMNAEYIIVGGGNRSTKIKMNPDELRKLPNVRVEAIAK